MSAESPLKKPLPSMSSDAGPQTVDALSAQLEALQSFVGRRFDEISMEINATAQQLGMAEDGLKNQSEKQFKEILETLGAISYTGSGTTQVNTGVELEAVIEDTEQAANTILDAADRIAGRIGQEDWSRDDARDKALEEIKKDVQDILLACTFQDLTGQRIRKTLENLHLIESRLSATLERLGIRVSPSKSDILRRAEGSTPRATQEDIDALFRNRT